MEAYLLIYLFIFLFIWLHNVVYKLLLFAFDYIFNGMIGDGGCC